MHSASTINCIYLSTKNRKKSLHNSFIRSFHTFYDGAGQRVATINNGVTNYLVYDAGGKLVAEYGQTASTNGTSYIFSDQQGSTRVVMGQDATGQMTLSRHDYEPFGGELQAGVGMRTSTQGYGATDSARQKYAGMETDDGSTLEHTLWRKYDSQSGRWTSPDPYGGSMSLSSPQSFNRYSYVGNDPVNQTDSLGLMANDASHGYESFEGWGGDPGFDDPHFGGPGIIGDAMARHDELVQARIDGRLAQSYLDDGNYSAAQRIFNSNSNVGLYQDGEALWGGDAAGYVQGAVDSSAIWSELAHALPTEPQKTSEAQQQPQSQDETWKEQLRGDIQFERLMIAGYRRYGRTAKTVEELEDQVNAYVSRRCHCQIGVAGSTTSSGQMEVRQDPNPYRTEATRRHEEVHHQTALRGHEIYGYGARFDRWWLSPRRWANDEVKAYSTDIIYMQGVLRQR